ncbi:MAG: DUF2282 domain-containing protein [Coxiellaceae bacterium]|nr:DUF2282 domain-containing protein [Coxiellaceae bacterium]
MSKKAKIMAHVMLTAAASLTVAGISMPAEAKSSCAVEKCYGIVKKAKNDCGTPKHACAAQAATSGDPSEWMFVMKGNCARIVGGSLTPPAGTTTSKK